jgi:hypothetical protein
MGDAGGGWNRIVGEVDAQERVPTTAAATPSEEFTRIQHQGSQYTPKTGEVTMRHHFFELPTANYITYWIERNRGFSTNLPVLFVHKHQQVCTKLSGGARKKMGTIQGQSLSLENGTTNVHCFRFLFYKGGHHSCPNTHETPG